MEQKQFSILKQQKDFLARAYASPEARLRIKGEILSKRIYEDVGLATAMSFIDYVLDDWEIEDGYVFFKLNDKKFKTKITFDVFGDPLHEESKKAHPSLYLIYCDIFNRLLKLANASQLILRQAVSFATIWCIQETLNNLEEGWTFEFKLELTRSMATIVACNVHERIWYSECVLNFNHEPCGYYSSKREIELLLQKAGVEQNPGPWAWILNTLFVMYLTPVFEEIMKHAYWEPIQYHEWRRNLIQSICFGIFEQCLSIWATGSWTFNWTCVFMHVLCGCISLRHGILIHWLHNTGAIIATNYFSSTTSWVCNLFLMNMYAQLFARWFNGNILISVYGHGVLIPQTIVQEQLYKETGMTQTERLAEIERIMRSGMNQEERFHAYINIGKEKKRISEKEDLKEGIELNPGPPSERGDYTEMERKEDRRKQRTKQYGDKKTQLIVKYKQKVESLEQSERWILTGDLEIDCYHFYELLIRQGYAPSRLPSLPIGLLGSVFRAFEDGYGLQVLDKVERQYTKNQAMTRVATHGSAEPGVKGRKLIVKYYFIHYYHHHKCLSLLLQNKGLRNQMLDWIKDGFRNGGQEMAKGFVAEVKPFWDKVVSAFSTMKNRALDLISGFSLGMGMSLIAILLGIVGYKVFTKYINILMPSTLVETTDEVVVEDQFFKHLTIWSFESWMSSIGARLSLLSTKWIGENWDKKLKEFGSLSQAVSNIFTLMDKMKKIMVWVIDSCWRFLFGTEFFESTKQVREYKDRLSALMKTIAIKDIANGTLKEQQEFAHAFEELVESGPWVRTIDPTLNVQITAALATAKTVYTDISAKIRFSVSRMKPVWIYLVGGPGTGKTNFQHHFPRLLYQFFKDQKPELYVDIGGLKEYDECMCYKRAVEQDYWDRYNNQWVCIYDDLFQSKEKSPAEAFSLIRAKNDAEYPLHMASITAKETTSFTSKLIITSTNVREDGLDGFPDIADIRAMKRRRDFVIQMGLRDANKAGEFEAEAIDNWDFIVHRTDKNTGALLKGQALQGYDAARWLLDAVGGLYESNFKSAKAKASSSDYSKIWNGGKGNNGNGGSNSNSGSSGNSGNDDKNRQREMYEMEFPPLTTASTVRLRNTNPDGTEDQCRFIKTAKNSESITVMSDAQAAQIAEALAGPKSLNKMFTFSIATWVPSWKAHFTFVDVYKQVFKDNTERTKQYMCDKFAKFKTFTWNPFSNQGWRNGYFATYGIKITRNGKSCKDYIGEIFSETNPCAEVLSEFYKDKYGIDLPVDCYKRKYISVTNELYEVWKKKELPQRVLFNMGYYTHEEFALFPSIRRNDEPVYVAEKKSLDEVKKFPRGKIETLVKWFGAALALGTIVGSVAAIGMAILANSGMEDQSNAKYFDRIRKEATARLNKRPIIARNNQFQDDTAYALVPKIGKNTFVLTVTLKNGNQCSQFCTGLATNIFVTASHIFSLPDIELVEVYSNREGLIPYQRKFSELKTWVQKEEDIVFFEIPGTQFVKDVSSHLPKRGQYELEGQTQIGRIDPADCSTTATSDHAQTFIVVPATTAVKPIKKTQIDKISADTAYTCAILHATQQGDCGKAYLLFNPKIQTKIAGIHIAGGVHEAVFNPIYYDDFVTFRDDICKKNNIIDQFKYMEMVNPIEHPDDPVFFNEGTGPDYLGMQYVGSVTQSFSWPHRTKLLKTPFSRPAFAKTVDGQVELRQPPFEQTHRPAILQHPEKDVVAISLRHLLKKKHVIWDEWFEDIYWKGIFNGDALKNATGQQLTVEEGIKGALRILNSHSISRNTSMAYCYQKEYGKKNRYVLTAEEHFTVLTEKEKKRFVKVGQETWIDYRVDWKIKEWFRLVDLGKIPAHMILYCIKDEPRPNDRVDDCKSRAFYMGAFVEMVISVMILGDFIYSLELNHYHSDVAVGINPYSNQWDVMYRWLKAMGDEGYADDASGWDINFQSLSYAMSFTYQYCKWFEITDPIKIRRVYAITYVNNVGYLVIRDKVYLVAMKFSGTLTTCVDNSIANSVQNRIAFRAYFPLFVFEEYTRLKVFGDDLVQTFKKGIVIDSVQYRKIFLILFGYERTNCFKQAGGEMVKLEDMEFLKRAFAEMHGRIYGRLSRESIHVMLQYIMEPTDKTYEAQLAVVGAQALMEISRYGKDEYQKYYKIINDYLRFMGPTYVCRTTWEEAFSDMYNRNLM